MRLYDYLYKRQIDEKWSAEMTDMSGANWPEFLCDANDDLDSPEDVEKGIAGADLMPLSAQLAGAGATGGSLELDLRAIVRCLPDVPTAFERIVEIYLQNPSPFTWSRVVEKAEKLDVDVRDRIRWHSAHRGDRRAVDALFALAYLSGTALQRVYAHGLLQRVARLGEQACWTDGCDTEILIAGLQTAHLLPPLDVVVTTSIRDFIMTRAGREAVAQEWSRIGTRYQNTIPFSPREVLERHHDRMTRIGHAEPRKPGEYDYASTDWRLSNLARQGEGEAKTAGEKGRELLDAHKKARAKAADVVEPMTLVTHPKPGQVVEPSRSAEIESDPVAEALDLTPRLYVVGQPSDPELAKLVAPVSGRAISLSVVPADFADSYARFLRCYPHATRIVERVLGRLRAGAAVGLERFLIVGAPGCGKSTFCIELASYLRLHATVYPCASVADGSFGGTPAHWSSRRPSVPMQAIVRARKANPLIVLDELEKTGQSDRNGSLVNSLLPMLEQHTACAYFETALELTADLSAVNFLATANSLEGVPKPLIDRFTVLHMLSPGLEHTEALAQNVVRQLRDAHEERYEERPDLAPDELAVIRKMWGGGSLRRLNKAIDATLEAREMHLRSRPQ